MQTTCPECRTTFRVSQDHLGARRGLVRCGTCNAVFNAYDTLLPELETPPDDASAPPARAQAESAEPDPTEVVHATSDRGDDGAWQPPADAVAEVPQQPVETRGASVSEPFAKPVTEAVAEPVDRAVDSISAVAESADVTPAPDILYEPMWPTRAKPARTWKFWLYPPLALVLVALLVLQFAYFLRAELAAAAPFTRPVLEALCRPLQCDVPLPRQLKQSAIAASALEHDPENKSRVSLTVLLANRTGQTQAWPSISLTLSDVRQAPVARQVFRPQVYLPRDIVIAAGMAADVEREVRLELDIGNLVASGYALGLTYP
jgi:predicted Zn finger-like uncharacterized protein